MEKARLAAFRLFEDQCGNGCCASLLMRSDCSMNSRALIGLKESNCCSAIGLAEAKARKSISRLTKATRKFVFYQRVPTRFTVVSFYEFHWNTHSSISLILR